MGARGDIRPVASGERGGEGRVQGAAEGGLSVSRKSP